MGLFGLHEEKVKTEKILDHRIIAIWNVCIYIDVWEGTSGTSADVPRFGLEIYSVSNAILDEYIFKNKFCEIEDLTLFTDRILAK